MIVGEEGIHIKPLYLVLMKNDLGNRKECRTLIKHHHVCVNGKRMSNENYQVKVHDIIEVDGQRINEQPFVYLMLNKPSGYICANYDAVYPCVVDLIDSSDCHCVGRLDKDTTGFVLLTNDATLTQKLLHPFSHVEKTYIATTQYPLEKNLIQEFEKGIVIDQNIQCLPSQLIILDDYHCQLTLYEGKYHQIKKMFLSCQNRVIALKRISFAGLSLDESLREGEWRHLTDLEFQKLKEIIFR